MMVEAEKHEKTLFSQAGSVSDLSSQEHSKLWESDKRAPKRQLGPDDICLPEDVLFVGERLGINVEKEFYMLWIKKH